MDLFGGLLKTSVAERELFEVLRRPRIAEDVMPVFAVRFRRIFAAAEPVTITERVTGCRNAKDDKFLELAVNGAADMIVSGDADLLVLEAFRAIPIVNPATFCRVRSI